MQVLRTPDERFEGLENFEFEPRYTELGGGGPSALRIHYVDEGPPTADPVLLLHGEPSWSYLYRKMIPVLVEAGHRCVAPDLVGFGRSDKPATQEEYSYARHVAWMTEVVFERLDLRRITLFCQDWGGLIGLRLVAADPDRFARVVVANTGLPTGDRPPNEAFLSWQRFARSSTKFQIGRVVANGCAKPVTDAVVAAYDAPFPDDRFTAGARCFPSLVPTSPDDPEHDANAAAWEVLERFDRPFMCCFSDSDPITAGGERQFVGRVKGTDGQLHCTIVGAGHFLQEDSGEEIAKVVAEFVAST